MKEEEIRLFGKLVGQVQEHRRHCILCHNVLWEFRYVGYGSETCSKLKGQQELRDATRRNDNKGKRVHP